MIWPLVRLYGAQLSMLFIVLPVMGMVVWNPELPPYLFVVMIALMPIVPQRATPAVAALPISARDHFAATAILSLLFTLLPIGAWALAALATGKGWSPAVLAICLAGAVLIALVPRLVLVWRPGPLDASPRAMGTMLGTVVVCGALLNWLSESAAAVTLTALALTALAAAWWTVPDVQSLAPVAVRARSRWGRDSGDAVQPTAVASSPKSSRSATSSWWTLLRAAVPIGGIIFPVLLGYFAYAGSGNILVMYLIVSVSIWYSTSRTRRSWLVTLPISIRQLAILSVLPMVLVNLASIAIGTTIRVLTRSFEYRVAFAQGAPYTDEAPGYFNSKTRVRLEYWTHAPDGTVPIIRAPWGEHTRAYSMRILGRTYYNPFSSREASSARFVDYQFRRATASVYGAPLSRDAYLAASTHPPMRHATWRMRALMLGAAAAYLLLMCLAMGWMEKTPGRLSFQVLLQSLLFSAPALLTLAIDSFVGVGAGTEIVLPFLRRSLMPIAEALPFDAAAVVVAALPALLLWRLLEWRLQRRDLVGAPAPLGSAAT